MVIWKKMTCCSFAALLSVGLWGCDNNKAPDGSGASQAQSASSGDDRQKEAFAAREKYSDYVAAYNNMVGQYGVAYNAKAYLNIDFQKAKVTDPLYFPWHAMLSEALVKLKQGASVNSDKLPELDKIAAELISVLEPLEQYHDELQTYYSTKAYRDDNLQKAREYDLKVRPLYERSLTLLEQFSVQMDVQDKAYQLETLEKLKQRENKTAYYANLNLYLGSQVLASFDSSQDFNDPTVFAKNDDLIKQMREAIDAQQAEYKKWEKKSNGNYEIMLYNYREFVSSYQDLKLNKEPRYYESMVDNYNQAVGMLNSIR